VKQQKAFLLCVVNVLNKSMLTKGFHYINCDSKETHKIDRMQKRMKIIILRLQNRTTGAVFAKWKHCGLESVTTKNEEITIKNERKKREFA